MEPSSAYRPRVSRETRLLLTAGIVALAVLWLLARVRFQDRPITPNPVPAVLSQLGNGPHFDELASDLAQLQGTLDPLFVMVGSGRPSTAESSATVALRWRDDLAIGWVSEPAARRQRMSVPARDPASGIAVFRVPSASAEAPPTPWAARRPQQPRFVAVVEPGPDRPTLRPVFVGGLASVDTPLWPEPVWNLPARADLAPGSFVFTSSAELIGLVVPSDGELFIVPAATLFGEASRLIERRPGERGTLGIDVQALTPALAAMTGAVGGVIVTWVDRGGPAGSELRVGDVIEAVDGQPLASPGHWKVWCARLGAGVPATLRVRRGPDVHEKTIAAVAVASAPRRESSLGLNLRARRGIGVEVVSVEAGSAADAAGLAAGDVITVFGEIEAPTVAQVTRSFAALDAGERAMVAFTRGDTHHVTAVGR